MEAPDAPWVDLDADPSMDVMGSRCPSESARVSSSLENLQGLKLPCPLHSALYDLRILAQH